jgi:hypothetical protein
MDSSSNVVKFPFNVSRKAHARKPRASKNGSPEERAAKSPSEGPRVDRRKIGNPLRSKLTAVSGCVAIGGKVLHGRWGFDLSTLDSSDREEWIAMLRRGSEHARYLADEFDKAIGQLAGDLASPPPATITDISRPTLIAGSAAAPTESLELWSDAGHLLRKLSDRKLLWAAVECMRLVLQVGTSS